MKTLLASLFVISSFCVFGQVEITKATENASAELEIVSPNNNTGVLIPTLTTAQMNAIASPSNALMVYNTDLKIFMYNAGTATSKLWVQVGQVPATLLLASLPAASAANEGMIVYNSDDKKTYFSNGSAWVALTNNP